MKIEYEFWVEHAGQRFTFRILSPTEEGQYFWRLEITHPVSGKAEASASGGIDARIASLDVPSFFISHLAAHLRSRTGEEIRP